MKKWWLSKTIWVNTIAAVAVILQAVTGKVILDAEVQAAILALINLMLRIITKSELTK